MSTFYPVIPAGGSGTRLWPLSRSAAPKYLHEFGGAGRSLIQQTVDRLADLAPIDNTYIVCGAAHAAPIIGQLPSLRSEQVLVEPGPRNSAPAIGLAAAIIHAADQDAVMGSFAADHLITRTESFHAAVRTGIEVAESGRLVTLGITPTRPETGYGYIRVGEPLGIDDACSVHSFKEKPALALAQEYLSDGGYVWNAGMFIWRVADLLAQLDRRVPELAGPLREIAAVWHQDLDTAHALLQRLWPTLPSISIDHAVMEGAAADGDVATVPADLGWSDVGDWQTVADLIDAGPSDDAVLLIDSPGSVALSEGSTVTVIGVPDVVVVQTGDAVLVVAKDQAQNVKEAVDAWRARNRTDLL